MNESYCFLANFNNIPLLIDRFQYCTRKLCNNNTGFPNLETRKFIPPLPTPTPNLPLDENFSLILVTDKTL